MGSTLVNHMYLEVEATLENQRQDKRKDGQFLS